MSYTVHHHTIFPLDHPLYKEDVGGKAYTLSAMRRAGFMIPNGFVVVAPPQKSVSPHLKTMLLNAFDALNTPYVAVRSSAVNEDSVTATWAGQLETFLNCTRDTFIDAIQTCWHSADTVRARSYAQQKNSQTGVVTVIVQTMIDSDVSGVAFSTHPISGDTTLIVVEAGYGLGEAVVSGHITPDRYIVHKQSGHIIDQYIAHQHKKLTRTTIGTTTWQDITKEDAVRQKLPHAHLVNLCAIVQKLEHFFEYPIDVEWALNHETLYILQSRPISTLTHT